MNQEPLIEDKSRSRTVPQGEEEDESRQPQSEPLRAVSPNKVQAMEYQDQNPRKPNNIYTNLQAYKKRMFITVSILFGFIGLLITERLISEILREQEQQLLLSIQEKLDILYWVEEGTQKYTLPNVNGILQFIGYLQSFLVNYLLLIHFFVTYYVSIDAIMAIKIMYPTMLGYYAISVLALIYKQARPFWVSNRIVSFTCQKTYGSPSLMSFILPLMVFYSCYLYSEKSMISFDNQIVVGPRRNHRKRTIIRFVGGGIIFLFLFCFYITGLLFIGQIALGFIYFGLFYTILLLGSSEVNDMIRRTALISDTSKKMIFRWMFGLAITQMIVTMIHQFSDLYPQVNEVVNYLDCLNDLSEDRGPTPLYNIIGPNATYCETSVVMGFIGLIFGVSYTFRNCKSSMAWYEGRLQKKIVRGVIANVCILPSWVLVYFQQRFLDNRFVYESGLSEFLLNSVHFLCLNFFLFGILPALIFEKFNLNKITDSFVVLGKKDNQKSFSFLDE